jgi:excisionase family DNA binding protein
MTTHEAAHRLGLTARSVARLIKAGAIKAVYHGRDYWIEEAEVERFERERRTPGRPRREVK